MAFANKLTLIGSNCDQNSLPIRQALSEIAILHKESTPNALLANSGAGAGSAFRSGSGLARSRLLATLTGYGRPVMRVQICFQHFPPYHQLFLDGDAVGHPFLGPI